MMLRCSTETGEQVPSTILLFASSVPFSETELFLKMLTRTASCSHYESALFESSVCQCMCIVHSHVKHQECILTCWATAPYSQTTCTLCSHLAASHRLPFISQCMCNCASTSRRAPPTLGLGEICLEILNIKIETRTLGFGCKIEF